MNERAALATEQTETDEQNGLTSLCQVILRQSAFKRPEMKNEERRKRIKVEQS